MSIVTHFHTVLPRRAALAGAALTALSLPTHAADLATKTPPPPPPAAYSWTGLYGGANFGFAFNSEAMTTPFGSASAAPSGVIGGGQLGYNFQFAPSWLVGIEAEFDGSTAQTTTNVVGAGAQTGAALSISSNHDWYGTLSGRFGYVSGPWLLFAKGGGAWMNADYQVQVNSGVTGVSSLSSARSGWNAGGGVEYQLTRQWTVKVQYDHLDFGTSTLNVTTPVGAGATTFKTQVNEVKAGVSYHFGGL